MEQEVGEWASLNALHSQKSAFYAVVRSLRTLSTNGKSIHQTSLRLGSRNFWRLVRAEQLRRKSLRTIDLMDTLPDIRIASDREVEQHSVRHVELDRTFRKELRLLQSVDRQYVRRPNGKCVLVDCSDRIRTLRDDIRSIEEFTARWSCPSPE